MKTPINHMEENMECSDMARESRISYEPQREQRNARINFDTPSQLLCGCSVRENRESEKYLNK